MKRLSTCILPVAILLTFGLILAGCGGSSPRFGNGSSGSGAAKGANEGPRFASKDGDGDQASKTNDGPRFGGREAEEESKENDKVVPADEIERVTSGTRSFKTEKNTALAPLDRSRMMREISRYMGTPYDYGGNSLSGIDCSGYTMNVYKNSIGRELPHSSQKQFGMGKSVSASDLKFGDLVFFNTTGESASHVGIYIGDDLFAHASVTLGVTISSLESTYYKTRYEGARRLITQ